MQEYHKIQSVYLRDPATNHRTFIEGAWSMPEFGYLARNPWTWTEKVDGTNIRVHWDGAQVRFGGRTDAAHIPTFLLRRLEELFPRVKFHEHFPPHEYNDVTLFGEGYGARIQGVGGNYKPDGVDFVLFDVMVGRVYLERHNVVDVANTMGIRVVPVMGEGLLVDAIDLTRRGFNSYWGPFKAEGLVLRPTTELRTRHGHRIITKVKYRDFQ